MNKCPICGKELILFENINENGANCALYSCSCSNKSPRVSERKFLFIKNGEELKYFSEMSVYDGTELVMPALEYTMDIQGKRYFKA